MEGHRLNGTHKHASLPPFFLAVFLMSALIWVAGPVGERFLLKNRPVELPLSSLMAFCPMIAAILLVQRADGWDGVRKLLRRPFDLRIKGRTWYIPIFLLMPTVMVLQYGLLGGLRASVPDSRLPVWMVLVFLFLFLIAAVGEEVGWTGYVIDRMQDRWDALVASIVLGTVWAMWHIVPLIQLGRTPAQIAWQCMDMIATRILIVWLYNNTGKSVLAAVLYHAMYNVSTLLLPNYGLHYVPAINSILVVFAAVGVTFFWGPKTLARFRYA
jgi:membrane protease YdiL (CAAX protease family)